MEMHNIAGKTRKEIGAIVSALEEKQYHGDHIFRWVHRYGVTSFEAMTDLSRALRSKLEQSCVVKLPRRVEVCRGRERTARFVFELEDGFAVESVLLPGERHDTLCLSTQVGCAFGCVFCLSGRAGFKRNLEVHEILGQFLAMRPEIPEARKTTVVFMGMGEPLDNLDTVLKAVAVLTDPFGPGLGIKRITLSTAGHIPGLSKLAGMPRIPKIAVSLNAPDERLRSRLMPINRKYPLKDLLALCRRISLKRGERIMFEYVLLGGLNDRKDDALKLVSLLKGIPSKINLIPFNPSGEIPFLPPTEEAVSDFAAVLADKNYKVTVRRSGGGDVNAACGQLALRKVRASARSARDRSAAVGACNHG